MLLAHATWASLQSCPKEQIDGARSRCETAVGHRALLAHCSLRAQSPHISGRTCTHVDATFGGSKIHHLEYIVSVVYSELPRAVELVALKRRCSHMSVDLSTERRLEHGAST